MSGERYQAEITVERGDEEVDVTVSAVVTFEHGRSYQDGFESSHPLLTCAETERAEDAITERARHGRFNFHDGEE